MFACASHFIRSTAEDKVRNRLAQIAREKLGIVSKEKQLQLERKKKAMEFLAQINGKLRGITKIRTKSQKFGEFSNVRKTH